MKKILVVTLAVIMMMSIGTIGAFAMGYGGGRNYVDADGDGICDNAGNGRGYVDADGDGICDNAGNGRGYVDTDGDGICDNAQYRETNHGCGFRGGRNK